MKLTHTIIRNLLGVILVGALGAIAFNGVAPRATTEIANATTYVYTTVINNAGSTASGVFKNR